MSHDEAAAVVASMLSPFASRGGYGSPLVSSMRDPARPGGGWQDSIFGDSEVAVWLDQERPGTHGRHGDQLTVALLQVVLGESSVDDRGYALQMSLRSCLEPGRQLSRRQAPNQGEAVRLGDVWEVVLEPRVVWLCSNSASPSATATQALPRSGPTNTIA
ncbi:hypothetical protein, partial [Streptomyces echinatus]